MALHGLPRDYSATRDQVLGLSIVLVNSIVCFALLRFLAKKLVEFVTALTPVDTSTLVSQSSIIMVTLAVATQDGLAQSVIIATIWAIP